MPGKWCSQRISNWACNRVNMVSAHRAPHLLLSRKQECNPVVYERQGTHPFKSWFSFQLYLFSKGYFQIANIKGFRKKSLYLQKAKMAITWMERKLLLGFSCVSIPNYCCLCPEGGKRKKISDHSSWKVTGGKKRAPWGPILKDSLIKLLTAGSLGLLQCCII